jgi:hypothetical protein
MRGAQGAADLTEGAALGAESGDRIERCDLVGAECARFSPTGR